MNKTIKILRNQNNYSQSSVAEYLGISRQMYIKYETGAVELSVKTIKSLACLYKVSTDVIFDDKLSEKNQDASYTINKKSALNVAEPQADYGVSTLSQISKLILKLNLSEQIDLMAKLAALIQSESSEVKEVLPPKNKKIPDIEYAKLLNEENVSHSYSHIRESLKNDEW